jgi:hypothetical protein
MNTDVDRYVQTRGMKEINAANAAYSSGFSHKPDRMAAALAKKRGNHELAAAIEHSIKQAEYRDSLVSQDLGIGMAKAQENLKRANINNDPQAEAQAVSDINFLGNVVSSIKSNPELRLGNEGIVMERVISPPEALVSSSQDIQDAATKQFGVKPTLFGTAAKMVVDDLSQTDISQRAAKLYSYATVMNPDQVRQATVEFSAVSPSVGVAMSLVPNSKSISPKVEADRLEIGTAILSGTVSSFDQSSNDKWKEAQQKYWASVEMGDQRIATPIDAAANTAYAYFAQKRGITDFDPDLFNEVYSRITGGNIKALNGKTVNFQLDSGEFADPIKVTSSINRALSDGKYSALDAELNPISKRTIINNGKLIPSGQNGLYYINVDGKNLRDNDGNISTMDVKKAYEFYNAAGKSNEVVDDENLLLKAQPWTR